MAIINPPNGSVLTLTAVGSTGSVGLPMKAQCYDGQAGYSLLCYITGTLTANVQVSNDPLSNPNNTLAIQNTARWINHDVLNTLNASKNSSLVFPVYAIRLNCSAYTSGAVFLDIGALDYTL